MPNTYNKYVPPKEVMNPAILLVPPCSPPYNHDLTYLYILHPKSTLSQAHKMSKHPAYNRRRATRSNIEQNIISYTNLENRHTKHQTNFVSFSWNLKEPSYEHMQKNGRDKRKQLVFANKANRYPNGRGIVPSREVVSKGSYTRSTQLESPTFYL